MFMFPFYIFVLFLFFVSSSFKNMWPSNLRKQLHRSGGPIWLALRLCPACRTNITRTPWRTVRSPRRDRCRHVKETTTTTMMMTMMWMMTMTTLMKMVPSGGAEVARGRGRGG
jgi:hypothetical protein